MTTASAGDPLPARSHDSCNVAAGWLVGKTATLVPARESPVSERFVRRAEWIRCPRQHGGPAAILDAIFTTRQPDTSGDLNAFWYFRRTFDLPSPAREAVADISADARCQLYVNGTLVGRGPARCDPAFQDYDVRDIAPYLRAGRNVVAVLVHSYGRDMSWYQLPPPLHLAAFGCAGLFFQCDVALENGGAVGIDSGVSWRCRRADAWEQNTMAGPVGFMEVFDARKSPAGWTTVEFDDGDWEAALAPSLPALNLASPARPFPNMVARSIPFLREEDSLPHAVLTTAEIEPVLDAADPFEQAEREMILAAAAGRIENADGLLKGEAVKIAPSASRDAAIVLDFGETVTGYPRLDFDAAAGTVIDIVYSERLRDGRPELPNRGPLTSPTVHRYIARDGRQQWEKFEWVGFRYLQVTARNAQRPVVLHRVSLNETGYPVEERGSFECSDAALNRIWAAGANTVRRCMHDGYEDCPSREQRQWVGDLYVEALTNYAAFGDTRLIARSLRQVPQSQRSDGIMAMATPGDLAARRAITIPDWGLCWVFALGEYVRFTGDLALIVEVFPSALRLLDWFQRFVDENGLLNNVPEWNFVDWAQVDRRGEGTAYNALYYRALRVGEELARALQMPLVAERLASRAEALREAINARLWDEERGVYVDACLDGVKSRRISQQSNAVCIANGIAPRKRWDRIFKSILDDSKLLVTAVGMTGAPEPEAPPFDEERHVVLAQPYFMHHVHRALVAAGRHDDLLRNIRRRWGAMLDAGATTIWEVWHPLASQCHGWSTTPTFDLSSEVLGVAPLATGFERVRIAPQTVDLAWAKGIFPTVKGDVAVSWRRDGGSFSLGASLPPGTTAEITLAERPGGGWTAVEVDGVGDVLSDASARARAGVAAIRRTDGAVTLEVAGPREIRLTARS